jgi:hypothetical protein
MNPRSLRLTNADGENRTFNFVQQTDVFRIPDQQIPPSQNQQLAAVMAERFFEQRSKGSEAPILRLLLEANANLRAIR